jgi:hypothetical protein
VPEYFRGQLKELFKEDLPKGVRALVVLKILGAAGALWLMALSLVRWIWPPFSRWFFGIDPEVGRQAIFFLSVVLAFLVLWAPRRRLPIAVAAVEHWSEAALVSVGNFRESAVFYGRLEVLEVISPGPTDSTRRAPVRPTWEGTMTSNRARLNREESGVLCLARVFPVDSVWDLPFSACLEDAGSSTAQRLHWGASDELRLRVRVRLTISRDEEKKRLPPLFFLRPARSSMSDFVIRGDDRGELSVEAAPAARRWWRRRQAKPATP